MSQNCLDAEFRELPLSLAAMLEPMSRSLWAQRAGEGPGGNSCVSE
jgi:hypothetical protein